MIKPIFYTSVFLFVIGFVGRFYAAQYSHVTPDGILQDSFWLPLGSLMIVTAIMALIVSGSLYGVHHFRDRQSL